MQRYYQIDDGEKEADLYLFGALSSYGQWSDDDPDRSAYNIVAELAAVKAPVINVHINSAGGEVSQGLAIYNTLKESGKQITTYCDGFACSAASVVFMAGSRRVMQAASLLMIHNAWTYVLGNAGELRKAADDVETVTQASVEAYKTVATISEEKIKELMDAETYILPKDALAYGFATEIANAPDTDGPQESAMPGIIARLTQPQTPALDTDALADRIAQQIMAAQKPAPAPRDAWAEFFGGKK